MQFFLSHFQQGLEYLRLSVGQYITTTHCNNTDKFNLPKYKKSKSFENVSENVFAKNRIKWSHWQPQKIWWL